MKQKKSYNSSEGVKEKNAILLTTVPSSIQQFNMNNIKILQELGYQVEVASNFNIINNIDEKRLETLKEDLKKIKVNIHNVGFSRNPLNKNIFKTYKKIKEILEEKHYEIVHCQTPICGVLTRIAARKCRKKGTKVIYTAHGFHFFKGAPFINWMIYYPIEKICAKWTDCLITINNEDYNIAKNRLKPKKVEMVNGVGVDKKKFDIEINEKEKQKLREDLGISPKDFLCINIGELNKNKNQIMAIKAVEELKNIDKNIKLLIVGKGQAEKIYQEYVEKNNLQENVKFLGYRTDIPQLLKISDCLLSVSFREGLPVNVMEAIMSKIPVIATNCRGNRDLVVNDKNGIIIQINDKEQLKESILKMKNTDREYEFDGTKIEKNVIEQEMVRIYSNI